MTRCYNIILCAHPLNARQIQRVLGNERSLLLAIEDITERKRLEAEKARLETQNRQLNKAESLGRMSGAIARNPFFKILKVDNMENSTPKSSPRYSAHFSLTFHLISSTV